MDGPASLMARLALALSAASWPAVAAPLRPGALIPRPLTGLPRPRIVPPQVRARILHRRGFRLRPFFGPRIGPLRPPPALLPSPPPGENLPPPVGEPAPLIENQPFSEPPLPQGFVLTVVVGPGQVFHVPATLNRYVEVGQALGSCFTPPASLAWGSITLRVSFKRDGSVFGLPRITYNDAGSVERKADLARSLLAALNRCTPLHLSPSLGAAVAGEIFAIRFIHQDRP